MLQEPIELLDGIEETLKQLNGDYRLVMATKGDLLDQERKLAQSGLGELFNAVEIVSDKKPEIYRSVFARHGTGPSEGMMVGNSLKSDVIPMIEAGGYGVHVPHDLTWALEHAEPPTADPHFAELPDLGALPDLVARLA